MNKMLLVLIVATSMLAQAQTSSTTTSSAPAGQTSATSSAQAAPKAAKKWSGSFLIAAAANENDLSSGSTFGSDNAISLAYSLTENTKIGIQHNFHYDMGNAGGATMNDRYSLIDPEIQLKTKYSPIGKSAPVAVSYRFYVPATRASLDSHRTGYLRVDASTEWSLSPKWAIGAYASPRWTMNNKGGTVTSGAGVVTPTSGDDVTRLILSPSATYSFNDLVNAYYAPALDYSTDRSAYGKITPRAAAFPAPQGSIAWNVMYNEVGVNVQMGSVTVNPAVISYINLNDGSGFAKAESLEYDLNVSGTF